MASQSTRFLQIAVHASRSPEIGRALWALEDTRRRTLEELGHLTPAMIDWRPADVENSIGTVLYHVADIEADWLYVEVLAQPLPPELAALFDYPTRDAGGHLSQVTGFTLEDHIRRLAAVRERLLAAYTQMELADYRRPRVLEQYHVTPEWVLHHLMQHEAEHRGQIGALRAAAQVRLVANS